MGFIVEDKYRTNELSLIPGGYTVCVREIYRKSSRVLEYTKIKKPHAYIKTVSKTEGVLSAWVKK